MDVVKIKNNILQTINQTPLIELTRIVPPGCGHVLLKLEYFSPMSSIKDRVALAMVNKAIKQGLITEETMIMEATSGNMGLSLAMVAAVKGLSATLVMPESVSSERIRMFKLLGAKTVLTPASLGMKGAILYTLEQQSLNPSVWIPKQYENPCNVAIHEKTTGPEIWRATKGQIDIFLTGVGTGATFTGVSRYLRRLNPAIKCIALEPMESAILSGNKPGVHRIPGIGCGFIPKNLDTTLITSVETVTSEEAYYWARRLVREEGILAGISTGANLAIAARLAARKENMGKTIVTIAPSAGERYMTTPLFSEDHNWDSDD